MSQKEQIQLTPEQIISLVGHGVTQEQLDSVRRELSEKIEKVDTKLDAKIDNMKNWLIGSLFTMLIFMAGGFAYIVALINKLPIQ